MAVSIRRGRIGGPWERGHFDGEGGKRTKLIAIEKKSNPRIFLSAGEASGDHYGAEIIALLRARMPEASFVGLGGTAMEAAGQERVVRAEDVAHMGLTEVIRHAPYIYRQFWRLVGSIKRDRPDVAILIDFPDVNLRLAKHLRRRGVPVLYFVSPQLWAWKRRRIRWVQQRVNRMLVIFPFEAPFYRAREVDAEFVGHPLAALPLPQCSREEYAERYGLDAAKQWVALLPGSREKEIALNLPAMLGAAAALGDDYEFVIPVASTITDQTVQQALVDGQIAERWTGRERKTNTGILPAPASKLAGDPVRFAQNDKIFRGNDKNFGGNDKGVGGYGTLVPDAREALFHARAAVVASGTATVQALTIGNPFVVVYRVSKLTFAVAKRMIRYPREIPALPDADGNLPVGMVNLVAGRRIVPELLNERFTAAGLAEALRPLLEESPERREMIADLAEARVRLLPGKEADPIGRVCEAVEGLLGGGGMKP
jgi:lipid-A-disaccharide synthase